MEKDWLENEQNEQEQINEYHPQDPKNKQERQEKQTKYRHTQADKGFVRFEIQVSQKTKARFDEMVNAIADEYEAPWDERRRKAKARADLFDQLTQGIHPDFIALEKKLLALQNEIQALSPSFFKSNDQIPLPEAIRALPDDAEQIKQILAKTYRETQSVKLLLNEYKETCLCS